MSSAKLTRCPKCGSTALQPIPNATLLGNDKQPQQKAAQCECGAVFTYLEPLNAESESDAD